MTVSPLTASGSATIQAPVAPPRPSDASAAPAPAPQPANPQLRIDPALNIVVLEFRGADGAVRHSLPTARELDAYRQGGTAEAAPMRVIGA